MNNIGDHKIVSRNINNDRWRVKVEPKFDGKAYMHLAHYNWLLGNPSFDRVPKGYVVHHLDRNELNDDISNLVIMQKFHHTAYHMKYKNIETHIEPNVVKLSPMYRTEFYPIREPRINKRTKCNDRWRLLFTELVGGERQKITLSNWQGVTIDSYEMAAEIKDIIWNPDKAKECRRMAFKVSKGGQKVGKQNFVHNGKRNNDAA